MKGCATGICGSCIKTGAGEPWTCNITPLSHTAKRNLPVDQAGLDLQRPSCLCFLGADIKGMPKSSLVLPFHRSLAYKEGANLCLKGWADLGHILPWEVRQHRRESLLATLSLQLGLKLRGNLEVVWT